MKKKNGRPANHPFSQSVDWIAKGAAQRGRTEGAVLPARRSAPEHDPYMFSEHSTTARLDLESILRREETGVPGENPCSEVEIDWN